MVNPDRSNNINSWYGLSDSSPESQTGKPPVVVDQNKVITHVLDEIAVIAAMKRQFYDDRVPSFLHFPKGYLS
ncbi:MAG TPA: hypothetical protein VMQ58_01200 [Candidatus Saccharimonadales bacterium]|nr:hypothetical protein [Candidatus Saccharimonadales bacterium]